MTAILDHEDNDHGLRMARIEIEGVRGLFRAELPYQTLPILIWILCERNFYLSLFYLLLLFIAKPDPKY